jgi:hypothetical protein
MGGRVSLDISDGVADVRLARSHKMPEEIEQEALIGGYNQAEAGQSGEPGAGISGLRAAMPR